MFGGRRRREFVLIVHKVPFCNVIKIIFEFRPTEDGRDNDYMGATADFVLKITSKTVEEVK